jgi:predicted methyltransferase
MPRPLAPLLALLAALAAAPAPVLAAPPHATRALAPSFEEDAALQTAISGPWRSPAHKARDTFRHPFESLTFWGLQPGMTIVEVDPGPEAWWSEILAPYAAATGGRYLAGYRDLSAPGADERARAARQAFLDKLGDHGVFGQVTAVDFGPSSGLKVEPASADFVLVARAFHNWARVDGLTDKYMAAFYAALKPGGVLAVEQHRAPEGSDPKAGTGYVPESYVIQAAQKAGFVLEAKSDLNANPKDTRNHPFGVWTLPPTRQSSKDGHEDPSFDHAAYDRIGESDRMTLRFRKPGA